MPRTARIAPGGMIFHVLNRGNGRDTIFEKPGDYAAFEKAMGQTLQQVKGMRLLGYCLMPNHWHLVLWPTEDGELGKFMQRLTVTHVRRWHEHRKSGGSGHLYQGTYKSFPIEADEHLLAVLRYVERNALRARLVERAELWRWSSLRAGDKGPNEIQGMLSEWPVEKPRDWGARVNRAQSAREEEAIRLSVKRGRPFGGEQWQQRTVRRVGLLSTMRERGRPRNSKR